MGKNIKLSVVIPCFNEQKRFKEGSDHYFAYLKKQNYKWELIFVNDGSTDSTLSLIKSFSKKNSNIKMVSYPQNGGKGYAIVQGILKSSGEIVLFSDLDHSVGIETIENFFPYFDQGYKVVIGSRRVRGASFIKRQSPIRIFLGRGFSLLVRIFIDFKIKDTTCGFKAFNREVVDKIFTKLRVFDWAFDAEILFLCKKFKIDVAQAPVAWTDVGGSKVSLKKDIARSLFGLIKIRINNLKGAYL